MDIKAKIESLKDKWESFKGNPLATHVACVFAGIVMGVYLGYR